MKQSVNGRNDVLTTDQIEANKRWADVARRTHALGPGTTHLVEAAVRGAVATHPLDAAEACLDRLESEPEP